MAGAAPPPRRRRRLTPDPAPAPTILIAVIKAANGVIMLAVIPAAIAPGAGEAVIKICVAKKFITVIFSR